MNNALATTNSQPDLKKLQQTKVAGNITINSIDELQRLGQILSQSGFFEDCKQAAQAVVKILAGSELGFPAFSSMVGIHIIIAVFSWIEQSLQSYWYLVHADLRHSCENRYQGQASAWG